MSVVGDMSIELDTVVIGSGPGGYVAAIRAAQLGQKVTIIEREFIGGVCLNVGCIPSKALITAGSRYQEAVKGGETFGINIPEVSIDWAETQRWKQEGVVDRLVGGINMLLKKNKVEIIEGEANLTDTNRLRVVKKDGSAQSYSFNHAILGTGSHPIEIPGFKYEGRVIDSTGALNLTEVPENLVVIGGGYIGTELAGVYANLGTKVTILEGLPSILNGFEKDMVKLVETDYTSKGVDIITNARAKSSKQTDKDVTVTYEVDGKEETVVADYVLVTVGRRPNVENLGLVIAGIDLDENGLVKVDKQGRTTNKKVFAIGDIVPGAALAHKASYEGKVAAAAIAGQPDEVDYVAMPAVCFSSPEIATVGLTEAEAKEQGLDVKASKFSYAGNGRAISMDATNGFIRLVSDKATGTVLGGQVAGAGASDLIAELGLAIEARMNLEDLALTIHAHPTLAENIMDAAELALGQPIHA